MEKKTASLLALGVAVMAIVFKACPTNGDITCQDAILDVLPCKPYLDPKGPPIPAAPCCDGVSKVAAAATSTEIRRMLCECFKKVATGLPIDVDKLKKLPELCKVPVPVPLDPKTDCSKINSLF